MESYDWNDAEQRVERAAEFFEQCRWQEALDELRAATTINPYNPTWLYNLGLTLDQLNRHEEAIEVYRQVIEIDPNDLSALQRLGADLHHLGRFKESISTFEKISSIDATFEPGYCGRILSYAELGEHQLAEEMFYTARLYKDQCPQCYNNMGISLAARKMYDKAIFCWQRALDLEPGYPHAHLCIAEALWNKGELELARQHYLDALRQEPGDVATLLDLADLLAEMGRVEEAGEKIRRAIEIQPDNPAGHYCLGGWHHFHGRDEDAQASLLRTIELDPTYPGVHLLLARIDQARQCHVGARRHLRAELLLRPENPRILMDLANHLTDVGETRPAMTCLKRLVQIEPENSKAWQNLAVVQFMRERYDEGLSSSEQAMKVDPGNVAVLHNLAIALGKLGDFEQALRHVRSALARAPKDIPLQRLELRLHVSRILHKVRRFAGRLLGRSV